MEDEGSVQSDRKSRESKNAQQLKILNPAFSQTPKPTRQIREQLAKETGLSMRAIQVRIHFALIKRAKYFTNIT